MASEYLKWKYRDVKPDEPPPPLTGWPKVKNWLHYNGAWLLVGAVLLGIVGSMLWNVLGIGEVEPDYIFAYVGRDALPGDTAEALGRELAALGEDVNGDGQVYVELRSYASGGSGDESTAMGYAMAAAVTLAADIERGESVFFITDDPDGLQLNYQILADENGALPADDDYSARGRYIPWGDCPVLAGMPLGEYTVQVLGQSVTGDSQELMSGLFIGRRGFRETEKAHAENEKFWDILTEGVASE